jgi:hypothetical protein
MRGRGWPRSRMARVLRIATLPGAIAIVAILIVGVGSATGSGQSRAMPGKVAWHGLGTKLPFAHANAKVDMKLLRARAFTLDRAGFARLLRNAPAFTPKLSAQKTSVVSLPDPRGGFQRFAVHRSNLMAPGLAARHPDITTYSGVGIDDRTATIHADLSHLGFHASVRSTSGSWYIDPYFHLSQSVYASYYGRDVADAGTPFVERDANSAELSVDKGYYHAADDVTLSGSGFSANADVTITISDPEQKFASRTETAQTDSTGSFTATLVADPDGNLETHTVEATSGSDTAGASYQVIRDDDPTTDPPTGDVLRTYRLALITDPGYADFVGGAANVTAAKVTLMNRVDQVYEDDLSIHMQLIPNNDQLNLNTWAQAIAPNGPCGTAPCFAQSNVTGCSSLARNRIVIGQIIGASNYDIGHLALGAPGGGVANLGVVGRAAKAQGCTGIPTPIGDFYAIDYVAHEMGHQFSGNHPFNGTQLNCSGGNRNGSTSTEPGSGSSVMAYAGICLTDDLQAHSDPYFSQRSQQEISTYTSSTQAAINENQEVALRHFGGGNEVQVATFGPGFAPTATIQPLTVNIGAVPSATQLGGAQENGNTVTISTGAAGSTHTLQPGDTVTIAGVANAGYNGTFTVTSVPTTRSFTYTNPTAGLPVSGGGTITLAVPGLRESGNTVTVSTAAAHGRAVGDVVTISGAGNAGYNGSWTITAVPTPRQFQFTNPTAGLPNAGGGTMTFVSPFNLRVAGNANSSALINSANYTNAGLTAAFAGIPGFAGTATVTGTATTGFTVTYTGAAAGTDVGNFSIQNLSCGGCFAQVDETNHGGTNDSFTLTYNGATSAPITNGTNYTGAGILAALTPILPAGTTPTLQAFGGGNISGLNNQGFAVSFGGTQAGLNVPFTLQVTNPTAGMSGFVNELDKGGAVDNKGGPGLITPTGDTIPVVTAPAQYTIPLRTPFALTGSAIDADNDSLVYSWEQNDRGGGTGTTLLSNVKTNGPLFAMFPKSGQISLSDALQYNSPGQNHLTSSPTRVFPDLQQIIDNNTNADTGTCPEIAPIAPPVPQATTECFAEFLPTSDYVGFTGVNASPLSLHMRLTARDGKGGTSSADTTLLLASNTGPFVVTAPNAAGTWAAGSTRTVTWNVANTDIAPVSTANVKISLSLDGGHTYPIVLAASTPNDGSESVTVPNVVSSQARVKVEAVGNVFFDISNANFSITLPGVIGLDSLSFGGKGTIVDSYDSSAGAYGPANSGSAAEVFSNGLAALGASSTFGNVRSALGAAKLDKGGLVSGNVTAGTTITNLGTIGGTASPNTPTPPIDAQPVAVCSPYSSAAGISGKFSYSALTGDLTVSGGKTATLADGTYCFHSVTLSGGSTLSVGGPVKLVVNGVFNASGGALVNSTHIPANLQISSSYAGANGVTLSGGSGAYLSVFAPKASVAISGSSPLFGAVLGKTLSASGGASIHYDTQLANVWASYFNP